MVHWPALIQQDRLRGAKASIPWRFPVCLARRTWVWLGAVIVVLAMAVGGWLFRGSPGKPQAAPEVIPLTTYPGSERSPSFSPDGNQVAFSWNGEKQDNYDIYVKQIGSTDTGAADHGPG